MKQSTKDTLKIVAVWSIWPLAAISIGSGTCIVRQHQCEFVCTTNGHEPVYLIAEGCYCKDERGLFNPKDSR